jgi:hypothetical protein
MCCCWQEHFSRQHKTSSLSSTESNQTNPDPWFVGNSHARSRFQGICATWLETRQRKRTAPRAKREATTAGLTLQAKLQVLLPPIRSSAFISNSWGNVRWGAVGRLVLLATMTTSEPAVPAPNGGRVLSVGGMSIIRGNRSTRRKSAPWYFLHDKSHIIWSGIEPGPPLWETATKCLSYGTAQPVFQTSIIARRTSFALFWIARTKNTTRQAIVRNRKKSDHSSGLHWENFRSGVYGLRLVRRNWLSDFSLYIDVGTSLKLVSRFPQTHTWADDTTAARGKKVGRRVGGTH